MAFQQLKYADAVATYGSHRSEIGVMYLSSRNERVISKLLKTRGASSKSYSCRILTSSSATPSHRWTVMFAS